MAALLATFTEFITSTISWLGSAIAFVVDTPYLLVGLCLMIAGFVWGLLRRAIVKS